MSETTKPDTIPEGHSDMPTESTPHDMSKMPQDTHLMPEQSIPSPGAHAPQVPTIADLSMAILQLRNGMAMLVAPIRKALEDLNQRVTGLERLAGIDKAISLAKKGQRK